ncbi:MAG: hypothetical protein WAN59_10740 [Candidatus Baltobacteraceae bacterium]
MSGRFRQELAGPNAARAKKIAASMRRMRSNGGQLTWTPEMIAQLVEAFGAGGRKQALAVFAHLRPAQVNAAIRRYCMGPQPTRHPDASRRRAQAADDGGDRVGSASCWDDRDFHRRFLEALTNRTQHGC